MAFSGLVCIFNESSSFFSGAWQQTIARVGKRAAADYPGGDRTRCPSHDAVASAVLLNGFLHHAACPFFQRGQVSTLSSDAGLGTWPPSPKVRTPLSVQLTQGSESKQSIS
jgi:hypothetical protein